MKNNLLYLDSNVIIAALSSKEKHSLVAQKLLQDIVAGEYKAVASSIVYSEILGITKGAGGPDLDLSAFFEQFKNFTTVAAEDDVCALAGVLRRENGSSLRLPDAIHLATALECKATTFITDDTKLYKIAQKLLPTKRLADLR